MIGEKITDKSENYTISEEIGRGGFGVVYLAHNENGSSFAIKTLGPVKDADTLTSFERETSALLGLDDLNVLKLIGTGEHIYRGNKYFFTVTEYCSEGNYRDMILSKKDRSVPEIVDDFKQILSGLKTLHDRVVHRDLKPENILILNKTLKIGDLGLSKSLDEATKTLTFKGGGTPRYMAPEIWERKTITRASDLYAIGVMLFEALTGRVPFLADDIVDLRSQHLYESPVRVVSINKNIPNHLDGLVRKLLEKDQNKRYQTVDEVLDILNTDFQTVNTNSPLVDRIKKNYDAEQSRQLEAEFKANEEKERQGKINYMEGVLLERFDEAVSLINKNIQETKITHSFNSRDRTYSLGNRTLTINFFSPNALYINSRLPAFGEELKKHHLIHAGAIYIEENRENRQGWNMVLVKSPEDSYGQWLLIESDISALSGKSLKYPPAATNAELLSENLAYHWMQTMHIWQLKDKPLDDLDIEKILDKFIP
ncbi:MAG: serine/threonine-protein kinase [bacterium]